jgi:hypothetical protein
MTNITLPDTYVGTDMVPWVVGRSDTDTTASLTVCRISHAAHRAQRQEANGGEGAAERWGVGVPD